ncbi:MAG: carboxyl transferase domain-containing protein [Pseudomonadota bacterium]
MARFESRVSSSSATFADNRRDMLALIETLRALEQRAVAASEKRLATFEKRGQTPPFERLSLLLDPGMPFLRLHSLANYQVEDPNPDTSVPGASAICGIGFINGVRCMVWIDDSGIRAGAVTAMSVPLSLSVLALAKRHKLPLVHCVESAGANLLGSNVEMWANGGALFRNLAQLSAAGIPTIAVLHGPSTAGGAYMPGLSDYVIGVRKNGLAALAGAALVAAATGERADERALGGAEMHASISGLVEYLAEDDAHALSMARNVIGQLDWNRRCSAPVPATGTPPYYPTEELAGLVPVDYKSPYDVRELMARIVDGSELTEFKPRFGVSTVCVQARIMGHTCHLIGNNGPIDPAGAAKATQFIQLADQAQTPLIFLHNTTGYIVGTESEQAGMIKHGAKMIQAVSNVRVPKLSLYVGASFGAGNYGMCGYAYEPDFLFAWPNAATNVMGGDSAAGTMRLVAEAKAARTGEPLDEPALAQQTARIEAHFMQQQNAFYTSGRLLDHGIIDPRDTRKVLGFCLATCSEARARELTPNSFGVARI